MTEPRNVTLEQIRNLLAGGSTSLAVEYTSLGLFYSTAPQSPTGEGAAGKARVSFGAGGNTIDDEFTILPNGDIVTNKNSIQYTFDIVLRPSRAGQAGNSIFMARFLYSQDGTETDTIQVGNTFGVRIDDADTVWREGFRGTFSPAVGSKIWIEIARDQVGTNSGLLDADQPTGTLLTDTPPWDDIPTASLEISKLGVATS